MRKLFPLLLITALMLSLFGVGEARVRSVALLPLADTGIDYNGVDLNTTATLGQLLADAGLTLLDNRPLRRFAAANYLRRSGSIDAFTARKFGRETGVDFVVVGTICEDGAFEHERFGLIMTVFETVNGDIVWSLQDSSSLFQETTLLGIGAPRDGAELKFMMLDQVAQRMAQVLQDLEPERPVDSGQLKLVDLQIEPRYLRGGDRVECRLRLQSLGKMPDRVELSTGTEKIELKTGQAEGEYYGSWTAPAADGYYGVGLSFYGASNLPPVTMNDYSGYTVINQAPQLELELKQGFTFNEVTVFREQLMITSRLQPVRPVSRWQVKVLQADGTVVVNDQMDGDLLHNLLWRGWNNQRQRLPDGEYQLSLILWDAAGNRVEATKKIAIQSECQPVEVGVIRKQEQNFIRLSAPQDTAFILDLDWKIRILTPAGDLLMEQAGSNLPAEFKLPPDLKVDFLFYSINVRDQIDNTYAVADSRLQMPEAKLRKPAGEQWSDDF